MEYVRLKGNEHSVAWCETMQPLLDHDMLEQIRSLPLMLITTSGLKNIMEIGLRYTEEQRPSQEKVRNALGRAMFYEYFDQSYLFEMEKPLPDLIIRTKRYIEEHFTEACNTESIAKKMGVTPRHLFQIFRKHIGHTPSDYLWQLRLNKARNLLCYTPLNISEIAYLCGFKNPYHFSRFVKKHYGFAPRDLRKKYPYAQLDILPLSDTLR